MKKYCLAVDIKNDPQSIAAYDQHHQNVWPEIRQSIKDAGIENMEIYRTGNRLFMIMEVNESHSFEKQKAMDEKNPRVQEWVSLMWNFLQPLSHTGGDKNWILMDQVFSLNGQ